MTKIYNHARAMHAHGTPTHVIRAWLMPVTTRAERRKIIATLNAQATELAA